MGRDSAPRFQTFAEVLYVVPQWSSISTRYLSFLYYRMGLGPPLPREISGNHEPEDAGGNDAPTQALCRRRS